MEDLLIETLEKLGYPVRRQGSLGTDEAYPDHFFTFWNNATDSTSYYDNEEHGIEWDFDVNFYSINPDFTYQKLNEAIKALKTVGFIISGRGYDVGSDEPTHTGRGCNAVFLEKFKGVIE